MAIIVSQPVAPGLSDQIDEVFGPDFRPMTADQARQLRQRQPSLSPWRVIGVQAIVALVVALLAWGLTGKSGVGWSAGYGGLAVVIPAALFARGLMGRFASLNAGAAMVGFFVWELVKIASAVGMLFAARGLIADLSWPAMLVGLVVTMKVYWIALLFAPRPVKI